VKKQLFLSNKVEVSFFLLLFVSLSFMVKVQLFTSFDSEVFTIIQEYKTPQIDDFFTFITKFSSTSSAIVIFTFISVILYKRKDLKELLFALFFFVSAAGGAYILKYIFVIPRPLSGIDGLSGYSYPSGHSVLALCLSLLMYRLVLSSIKNRMISNICIMLLLIYAIVSISARVILGAHWFSDTLGSIVFVFFIYHLILEIMMKLPIYEKLIKMVENDK